MWHGHIAPAVTTCKGGTSGGVAIFTKCWLGHEEPFGLRGSILQAGRLVLRLVHAIVPGGFVLGSIYLPVEGVQGGEKQTQAILTELGHYLAQFGRPFVIGGDWNRTPATLESTLIPRRLDAEVVFTEAFTCTSKVKSGYFVKRHLDYFLMSSCLVPLVKCIQTVEGVNTRPHVPVQLVFRHFCQLPKVRMPVLGAVLPVERPQGPVQAFEGWDHMRHLLVSPGAEAASSSIRDRPKHEVSLFLQRMLNDWSAAAAAELQAIFQVSPSAQPLNGDVSPSRPPGGPASKLVYPAWTKSASYPRACKDATAWRCYEKAICDLQHATGKGIQQLIVRLRKWKPPNDIAKSDPAFALQHTLQHAAAAARRFWRQVTAPDVEWLDFSDVRRTAADIAQQLERRYLQQSSVKWRHWIRDSVEKGGKRLLQWLKVPETALPRPTLEAPHVRLERIDEEWQSIWVKRPKVEVPATGRELPPLLCSEVISACKSFDADTAVGEDRWRPKHIALLAPAGLHILTQMLNWYEQSGVFMGTCTNVIFLDKPGGGERPIGLLPTLYRIWAKARRPYADLWEKEHHREFFWLAPDASTEQAVHFQGLRAEHAAATGQYSTALLTDITKAYEHVCHARLVTFALQHEFPLSILRLCLEAYASPRRLMINGCCTEPFELGGTSLVAGCSMASTLLKLYMLTVFDTMTKFYTHMELDVFADDIDMATSSSSKQEVVTRTVAAAKRLVWLLENVLHMKVSTAKCRILASHKWVKDQLQLRLQGTGLQVAKWGLKLGVQYTLTKQRRAAVIAARLHKAGSRAKRLGKLRMLGARARARLYGTAVKTVGTYGGSYWGFPNHAIKTMRQQARLATTGKAGASFKSTRLFFLARTAGVVDPAALAHQGPIGAWARTVWAQRVPAQKLETILAWARGKLNRKQPWRAVTGPAQAYILTLARLAWHPLTATTILLDDNRVLDLREVPPCVVSKEVAAAVERWTWRAWARDKAQPQFMAGGFMEGVHKLTGARSSL